jgi:ligand-binding sensor domain-containing protein/two-component sensor histidine kinase
LLKKIIYSTLFLLALFGNLPGNAQNFHFSINASPLYFDKPEALQKAGISDVHCMYKDSRGFMWFGTENGLYRFDGSNVVYAHHINNDTTSLSNNSIISIAEDSAGDLWIGTTGGAFILNAYTLKCTRLKDANYNYIGYKMSFFTNDKKVIWAATDDGLYRYNYEKKFLQKIWDGKEKNNGLAFAVTCIGFYGNDTLALGTLTGLVLLNKNNLGFRQVPFYENNKDGKFITSTLHVTDEGELWIGTWAHGLLHYNRSSGNFSVYKWQKDNPGGVSNIVGNIITINTDGSSTLYFSCGTGIFKMPMVAGTTEPDTKNISLFGHDDKLPNSISNGAVKSLYKDDIDNLWMGLAGEHGINKITVTKPVFNTLPVQRDGAIQESQQITWGGKKYFCVSNWHNFPALQIFDSLLQPVKSFMQMPPDDTHPDASNVSAVAVDKYDRLWVSSWRGIVVMDKKFNVLKTINRSSKPDTLTKDKNNYLLISGDSVWIASYKNGIDFFNTDCKMLGHIALNEHGLNEDLLWKMYKDTHGGIWLLGNAFFHHYNAVTKQFKQYTFSSDNTVPSPVDVAEKKDGSFLIATRNGLVHFDPATEKYSYIRSPLLQKEDNINSVCTDENDNAWFLTASHLVAYDFKTHNFTLYGKEDGLDITDELMSIRLIDKNKFLIGQHAAFTVFTPNISRANALALKVLITGLSVNDSSITTSNEPLTLQLSYYQNRLSFNFSAINYIRPEQNNFAYRLKGADTGWTYTYNGFVSFANLAPGNYSFEVKVQNYAGVWSNVQSVSIIIKPPFWKTWWFISLVVLAFAVLFYAVVKYITQRNLKEKILLLEKEQAIEKERNRIARDMHDDLGSGLTKIAILSEVAKTQLQQPDKAKAQLENISVSSRELVDSMQDIIWVLNPKNDTLESLASYIREYALKFFEPFETSLQFKYPDEIPVVKLTEEQRRNIFLVIKESFNNIAKHAWCNNVVLQLSKINNNIIFSIEDDGKGFDISNTRAFGNGLQNMRNRMQQIDGNYTITSALGNGTVTRISVLL